LTPAALAPGRAALKGAAFFFGGIALLASLSGCASVDRFGGSRQAVIDWGYERGFDAGTCCSSAFACSRCSASIPRGEAPC
jgi:hypothetical protein